MRTGRSFGGWRAFLWVAAGFCRMVGLMAAVFLVFPVAVGRVILALVAMGWLPPGAAVAAYLLPIPFFGFAVLLPLVFSLRDRARWARVLFRTFVGDVEERFEQLTNRFCQP